MDALTGKAREVAERVLDEEGSRRRHLVVVLSGAHAYGFPSPDSDLDLKGIHIEPTERLLGLRPPATHATRVEVLEGVEIDYSSNELGKVLVGILGGNGNYLERILGSFMLRSSPEHESLRPLVRRALSRRFRDHYAGFARGQLRELETAASPTAKKVLYVLRTALTGAHLLRTGELVADLNGLLDGYGLSEARELIAAKRAGERVALSLASRDQWVNTVGRALEALDRAYEASPLPAEPPNSNELENWLIDLRRAQI